jgi:peptidoglycan/LPS O-acetylase OafA/YrhL
LIVIFYSLGVVLSLQIAKNPIESLTGIRFYAAMAVFFSHLTLFGAGLGWHGGTGAHFLENLGGLGVSVFFVLSGAMMVLNYVKSVHHQTADKVVTPWQFWQARVARIYPAYFVSYIFLLPLAMWQQAPNFTWGNLLANLTFVGLINLEMPALNPPAWSILAEVLFYLVFPLLLPLLCQRFWRNWLLLLLGYTLLFVIMHWPTGIFPEFFQNALCPYSRMFEFIWGMGLGGYWLTGRVGRWPLKFHGSNTWLYVLLAGSMLAMLSTQLVAHIVTGVWPINWTYYGFLFPIPFSTAVIGVLYLLEIRGAKLRWLRHPWVLWGGEVSYSFYLLHYTVLGYGAMAIKIWGQANPANIMGAGAFGFFALSLLVTLLLSAVCYRWVEVPGRRWIRGWQRPKWLDGAIQRWSEPTMAKAT